MSKVLASQLSEEVILAANELYQLESALPSTQMEYSSFSAHRIDKPLGGAAISLTESSYGDEGGYEGHGSQVVLKYSKGGELKSISSKEEFEPSGPLIVQSHLIKEPREGLDKLLRFFSPAERKKARNATERKAARYISHTLSLAQQSAE